MKAWVVERYGRPRDVLVLRDVPEPSAPRAGQVVIDVEAIAINMQELDMIWGRYETIPQPVPFVPGAEVLGVVTAAGPDSISLIGRRVVGQPRGLIGGYAEKALMPVDMVFDAPDLSVVDATAVFWPFHVAYYSLHNRGALSANDKVLIHAGAGGVGSAAVQLAVASGARVIATASTQTKRDLCVELGAEAAVDYSSGLFADEVIAMTDGCGVDLIFDTVGGAVTRESWQCAAFGARHLIVGFSSGIEQEDEPITLRPIVSKNISLVGCLVTYAREPRGLTERPQFNLPSRKVGEEIHSRILELLRVEKIKPVVGTTTPFDSLPDAVDRMDRRETTGRTIVTLVDVAALS